jgi:TatA/E family protein of Tat protein translocase
MFGIELPELLIIVIVIAVLFGGNKIVGFARSLGRFKGEFKKGQKEIREELKDLEEKEDKDQEK